MKVFQGCLNKFCPKLKKSFELTMPTCYEYEHVLGEIDAIEQSLRLKRLQDKFADKKENYQVSLFSRMEMLLLTRDCDFVDVGDKL